VALDDGLVKYCESLKELVKQLNIEIIILCDGGCDSIMTGIEKELGTPVEDIMSMIATFNSKVKSYLITLGSTVDTFGEIDRNDFLKNIEELEKKGLLLDKLNLTMEMDNVQKYVDVTEKCSLWRSMVNTSIVAKLKKMNNDDIRNILIDRNIDTNSFIFDDYITTCYLFNLNDILFRIRYVHLIFNLDDSDGIDDVIMNYNG